MSDIDWSQHFYYDQGNLFWKHSRGLTIKHGMKAGSLEKRGRSKRVRVGFNGKHYSVADIIYTMLRKPIPKTHYLYFINGDPECTAIWNLKLIRRNYSVTDR